MLRNFKIPQQGESQSTLIQKLKKGHCLLSNEVKNYKQQSNKFNKLNETQ
jgi:hypothetical protein